MLAMLTRAGLLAAEAAGAGNEKPPNPVIPKLHEAFWTFVFFVLLYALVRSVLLPPILARRAERDGAIRAGRDAAERAREQVAATQAEYDAALAGARAEATRLLETARAEADAHRARLQADADAELAAARQAATDEIAQARTRALTSVRTDVTDLAVTAASAVMQRRLDAAAQSSVVERALAGQN